MIKICSKKKPPQSMSDKTKFILKLDIYTHGIKEKRITLAKLILSNLDELHHAILNTLLDSDTRHISKAFRSNNMTKYLLGEPSFIRLLKQIESSLKDNSHASPELTLLMTEFENWRKAVEQAAKDTY
jgi:hypothetical protein